jgi:hypothetical protein
MRLSEPGITRVPAAAPACAPAPATPPGRGFLGEHGKRRSGSRANILPLPEWMPTSRFGRFRSSPELAR